MSTFDSEHQKRWLNSIANHLNHGIVAANKDDVDAVYFRIRQIFKISRALCFILEAIFECHDSDSSLPTIDDN